MGNQIESGMDWGINWGMGMGWGMGAGMLLVAVVFGLTIVALLKYIRGGDK